MKDATSSGGSKWDLARDAVMAALAAPELANANVALTYFPRTSASGSTTCDEAEYAMPDLDFASIAQAIPTISASLSAQTAGGTSPDGPALAGASAYARTWGQATGSGSLGPFVVLISDGYPTNCNPQDAAGLAQLAANAAASSPSVSTAVVAAGWEVSDVNLLDGIAMAGGGVHACLVDLPGAIVPDVTQLTSYLHARTTLLSRCAWPVPIPDTGSARWTTGAISRSTDTLSGDVERVVDASACDASTGGWYYDADVAAGATPSQLTLCPATCAAAQKASPGSTLSFAVDCGP
jgi:hypothetical protein